MVPRIIKYAGLAALAFSVSCSPSDQTIKDASLPAGIENTEESSPYDQLPPELRATMEERVLHITASYCNNKVNAMFLQQGYKLNCGEHVYVYSHQDRQMLKSRMEALIESCGTSAPNTSAGTLGVLTPESFDEKIKSKPAVVLFGAEWCPSCREMEPIIEGFCSGFNGAVFCGTYNIEQDEEREDKITERYKVLAAPMMRFFCNGEEQERLRLDGIATDRFCMVVEISEDGMPARILTDTFCDYSLDKVEIEGEETEVLEGNRQEYLQTLEGMGAEQAMPYWREWIGQQ
ncbi:MAG: thioredoxin family protein [Nanoarchaeota archaeon]|nr:thioredoxin family protein [Nanoarchaeota archaeon]